MFIRPHGHLKLQDEYDPFDIALDGTDSSGSDAGSNVVLNGTAADSADTGDNLILNGTNSDGANSGGAVLREGGDGFDATDTMDSTSITFDTTISDNKIILNATRIDQSDVGGKIKTEIFLYSIIQHDGFVLLNGTDGSSTNAGNYLDWENGTYSSLVGSAAVV